jgi:hypothetical protein
MSREARREGKREGKRERERGGAKEGERKRENREMINWIIIFIIRNTIGHQFPFWSSCQMVRATTTKFYKWKNSCYR